MQDRTRIGLPTRIGFAKNRTSIEEEGSRQKLFLPRTVLVWRKRASDWTPGSPTVPPALRLLATVALRLDPRLSDFLRLGQIRRALLTSALSDGHPPV